MRRLLLRLIYVDVPVLRPGTIGAYALAFVAVGVATMLRVALDSYVVGVQFITFFPAIVTTTVISGFPQRIYSGHALLLGCALARFCRLRLIASDGRVARPEAAWDVIKTVC
jgi:hypothetical protein